MTDTRRAEPTAEELEEARFDVCGFAGTCESCATLGTELFIRSDILGLFYYCGPCVIGKAWQNDTKAGRK